MDKEASDNVEGAMSEASVSSGRGDLAHDEIDKLVWREDCLCLGILDSDVEGIFDCHNYFDGVQFDRKPETLNQFFRSVTPNTGPYDAAVIADAMSALFTRIGSGILFTHSQAGGPGRRYSTCRTQLRMI